MSEWKDTILDYACKDVVTGGTPLSTTKEYFENGNIPWLKTKEVNFNKITATENFISSVGLANSSAKLIPINSVIVAMYGQGDTAGRVAINKIPLSTNQACCNLIIDETKADYNFIYYFLSNSYEEIVLRKTGSAQPNLNTKILKEFPVLLPPLPEQKSIATILSSLDDKIDLLHQQNATLEKMAETLFRQWFVEEAKEDWESKQLKEVTDIAIGRTPPRNESKWFTTKTIDIKWISIKDLGDDGVFISNTSEYLTKEAVETFNIPVIPKDTVVLSFKMTVGRVAITSEVMLSNEAIAHFKFNKNTPFSKEYLYIFLKRYKYETLGSTSSIVTAINSAMIKDIEIRIPDEFTMKAFKYETEPLFNRIKSNQNQICTLTALRDTLLPKLMSGEVRVEI